MTQASIHHFVESSNGCLLFGTALFHHRNSSSASIGDFSVFIRCSIVVAARKKFREGRAVHASKPIGLGRSERVRETAFCCRSDRDISVFAEIEMVALLAYAGRI